MESARDKAVRLLGECFLWDDRPNPTVLTAVVDAIIDAARSSESEHTRALDVRGTTGGKATTETS